MIIGINYTDAGDRTIDRVLMNTQWTAGDMTDIASELTTQCDEVYIIPIDKPLDKLFDINAVVTEGCRITN